MAKCKSFKEQCSIKQLLNPENCKLQKLPVNLYLHWLKTPTTLPPPKAGAPGLHLHHRRSGPLVNLWAGCAKDDLFLKQTTNWEYEYIGCIGYFPVSEFLNIWWLHTVVRYYTTVFCYTVLHSLMKSCILDGDVKGNQSRSASSFQKTTRLYHRYPQFHSLMGCALSCMRRPTQQAQRLVPAWCTKSKKHNIRKQWPPVVGFTWNSAFGCGLLNAGNVIQSPGDIQRAMRHSRAYWYLASSIMQLGHSSHLDLLLFAV